MATFSKKNQQTMAKDMTSETRKRSDLKPQTRGNPHKEPRKKPKGRSSNSTKGNKTTKASSSSSEPPAKRPRRHADTVEEGKRLWNELRKKTNTPEHTRKLMDELMPLITGKASELALQHDASRVVQAAIQFGTPEERKSILKELCHKPEGSSSEIFLELCKSQYAHFVVLKAIKYGHTDKDCAAFIVKVMRKHISKLCVHGIASRVVESLFQTLPPKQTAALKQEFYGPHFSLFASDTLREQSSAIPTLSSNLAAAPDKKDQTVDFVRRLVQKGIEKQLYGYSYFQELLDEFLQVASPTEVRSLAGGTASDHCIHLLSTRAGTRAVCWLIAYGTARDRKRVAKSLKGYSRSGLLHRDAYLAVLRLVQLTDDTVSTHKHVFHEILAAPVDVQADRSPLLDLALSECASKLFLLLLDKTDDISTCKFLDPYERSVLFPHPTVPEGGEEVPTSKKDPEVRRQELLRHLREPLVELCCRHADVLLRSPSGGRVCARVYASCCRSSSSEALVRALTDACLSPLLSSEGDDQVDDEADGGSSVPLLEDRNGHLAIKALISVDAGNGGEDDDGAASSFAVTIYERAKSECPHGIWDVASQSNRGAFVAEALCKIPAIRGAVLADLKTHHKALKKASEGKKGATAGYAALLNEIQGNKGKSKE